MRDVIIASANRKSAEHIKSILQRDLLFVSEIYQSGAEVLSYASIRPDAVVVCGRLSDGLPAVARAATLPPGFDVVHLVSSSDAYQGFVSNMVELTMPLDRVEFVSVVRTLTQLSSDITSRKKTRSVEENDLLTLAKQRLCENYGISEREAHRKIQKMSMEQGVRLMDVARKILEED